MSKRGRPPNSDLARKAYEIIKANPGITPYGVTRLLGLKDRRSIKSVLTSCENNNLLLWEEQCGRNTKLYAWSIEDSEWADLRTAK